MNSCQCFTCCQRVYPRLWLNVAANSWLLMTISVFCGQQLLSFLVSFESQAPDLISTLPNLFLYILYKCLFGEFGVWSVLFSCWFTLFSLVTSLLHVIHVYQTQKMVFNHSSKPQGESWKCDTLQSILENFEVFENLVKHHLDCLIYLPNRS